jgi:PAS domain S-box-containing protein
VCSSPDVLNLDTVHPANTNFLIDTASDRTRFARLWSRAHLWLAGFYWLKSRSWRPRAGVTVLLICVFLLPSSFGSESKPIRRILILNGADPRYPVIKFVDDGIQSGLSNSPYESEFYLEYMETVLFPDPADQQLYRDFIIRKYQGRRPDVIITVGSPATEFIMEAHRPSFSGVPIVFCYPNVLVDNPLTLDPETTAVEGDLSPARTIDAALRLLPHTSQLVVVTGVSLFDRHYQAMIKEQLRVYEHRLRISYLTDLPLPSVLERLRHLPSHTIVLIGPYTRDTAGPLHYTSNELGPMLVGASNAPVFSLSDRFLNHGEVGGDVSSALEQGRLAAGLAVRLLSGERNVPPVKESTTYMFDWRALRHWGLDEKNLPPGSIVLNREPSLWETYKQYVIVGLLVILAQALAILGLLWQRARRRKTEAELRMSEEKFSNSFRHSPLAITIVSSSDGRYMDVNETFEERTGWKRDEVIGRTPLEIGLWVDPNQRSLFLKQIVAEGNMRNIEVKFRRKDGQIRTSLGSAELIEVSGKKCILSVIADITERKQAEEAMAGFSRRLIEAQEAERTRIARELHDDISQRMAMLAVRAKSLKRELPPSEVKTIRAIEELRVGASRLQTDVQGLSHRLHSPKLDYLGLEAASAAFCRELSEQHEVEIGFHAHEVPEGLPSEVSLCLYRVLQEALQNALKHSGVREFKVFLKTTSDELQLTVHDSGVGFDAKNSVLGKGLGLTSMKERLKLVDGQLVIESSPQQGTKIVALVPLALRVPAPYDSQARDH